VEGEDRVVGNGTVYSGVIQDYSPEGGWGLLLPDDVAALPPHVQTILAKAARATEFDKHIAKAMHAFSLMCCPRRSMTGAPF
jgi:hypothetical protein